MSNGKCTDVIDWHLHPVCKCKVSIHLYIPNPEATHSVNQGRCNFPPNHIPLPQTEQGV